jgi:hypothetical protein
LLDRTRRQPFATPGRSIRLREHGNRFVTRADECSQ